MKKILAVTLLLIAALAYGQGSQFDFLLNQQRNASGSLAGGTATFYAAGTLTPKAIYSDIGLTNLASNPYTLSSQGKAMVYGSGLYKVVVKDSNGVTQYTFDYVSVNSIGGFTASQTPVAGEIPILNSDKSLKVKTGSTTRTWMVDAGLTGIRLGSLDYNTSYLTGGAVILGAGYDPLGTSSVNSAKQTLDASGNLVVSVSTNSAASFTHYSTWTPGRGTTKLNGFSTYSTAGANRIPIPSSTGHLKWGWQPTFKGALVYVAAENLANNTITPFPYVLESYDTDNIHDNVTNNTRLTVPAGVTKIRLCYRAYFAANATGYRHIYVTSNVTPSYGLPIAVMNTNSASLPTVLQGCSMVMPVSAADYFELNAVQTSGGALLSNATFSMEIIE
jgi:hypothetical protein